VRGTGYDAKPAPGQFVAERKEWNGPLPHRVYRIETGNRCRLVATNEPAEGVTGFAALGGASGRGWVAVRGGFESMRKPMNASDLVNLWSAGELATGGFEWAQANPGVFATCTLG
jgi:hypothetical protein